MICIEESFRIFQKRLTHKMCTFFINDIVEYCSQFFINPLDITLVEDVSNLQLEMHEGEFTWLSIGFFETRGERVHISLLFTTLLRREQPVWDVLKEFLNTSEEDHGTICSFHLDHSVISQHI